MKILLTSHCFHPSVGGIESMTDTLAGAFTEFGHTVTVVTETPDDAPIARPYRVLRQPTLRQIWQATREADVVLQNQPSLKLGWAALLARKPLVIAHHMWTAHSGRGAFLGRIKHAYCAAACNVAVSQAMARSLRVPATVIANPYREKLFRELPDQERKLDLVCLGRLVDGKGIAVAIRALRILHDQGHRLTLNIIGKGPEETRLREQVKESELEDFVHFAGVLQDEALVTELNRHRILLVPSVWDEPFGLVAIEGMACGLQVIVSDSGGLPEAVGKAGMVIPRGDAQGLADAVVKLLENPVEAERLHQAAARHLLSHHVRPIADRYVAVLEKAMAGVR